MEELVISSKITMMSVHYTRGRQLMYKDHICNLPHNIASIARSLPRLPEDCDKIIIRRDGVDMSHHIDFVIRRDKVRAALEYKIMHDPAFSNYQVIDEDSLSQLPMNGSVVDRIPTCREGQQ